MKRLLILAVLVVMATTAYGKSSVIRCDAKELALAPVLRNGDDIAPREIERGHTYGLVTFTLYSDWSELFTFYMFSSCTHDVIDVRFSASCVNGPDEPCAARDALALIPN